MTIPHMTIRQKFDRVADTRSDFPKIINPPYPRPDLCAFVLLHRLSPGKGDMITAASHDQIWLGVDMDLLEKNATDDDVLYLARCGVWYDSDHDCLSMFV